MSGSKDDLDQREIQWFWDNRRWKPEPHASIDEWLMEMRQKDELLMEKGCFPVGHFEETMALREAVDKINERRKLAGLEPLTEEQALK